jgi:hypothetical protein
MRNQVSAVACSAVLALTAGCGRDAPDPDRWWRAGAETDVVRTYRGSTHCDWQDVTFMTIGWPLGQPPKRDASRAYVRDPKGALDKPALRDAFRPAATVPPDAAPSGYVNDDGQQLWLAPSDQEQIAYLVAADRVEGWPRLPESIPCA